MKKYLITGGAGYIGSHVIHYFISKGVNPSDIFVFDNLSYGNKDFLPEGVNFIKGDLLNKNEIEKVFIENKIDCVLHFAAYISVSESVNNPGKYFENNVFGGLNLLEAMKKGKCNKLVFSSTAAVYAEKKELLSEDDFKFPISPYGESKLMMENMIKYYVNSFNVKAVIFRYFNASGAGFDIGEFHDPETHLIPLVLKAIKGEKDYISIYGIDYNTCDGTCVRDYVHVLDLARAHYMAIDYLDNVLGMDCFNLGMGKGVSVKEIIEISKRITGRDLNILEEGRRSGDSEILVANPSRANMVLKWEAKYSIEDIIKSAWEWEK